MIKNYYIQHAISKTVNVSKRTWTFQMGNDFMYSGGEYVLIQKDVHQSNVIAINQALIYLEELKVSINFNRQDIDKIIEILKMVKK